MQTDYQTFNLSVFFTACTIGSFIILSLLVLLDVLFFFWDIAPSESIRLFFIVPREDGLANWYSSLLTLSVGLIAFCVFQVKNRPALWLLVGIFFLYAAIDDAAAIHERLGVELKMWVDDSAWDVVVLAFPSYSWQLFIAPIFVFFALFIAWRLSKELQKLEFIWMAVGFTLLAAALLIDFIEGLFIEELTGHVSSHLLKLCEEALEMCGMTLVFYSFATHLGSLIEVKYRHKR